MALVLAVWSPALATNFTYGAWKFTLPDDAKQSVQDGIRAFGVSGSVYLFTPPAPLAGRTLEQVAATTMQDITQKNAGQLKSAGERTLEGGTLLLAFSGPVIDPKTGAGNTQIYFFFARNEQWGLALLMLTSGADEEKLMAPLAKVSFSPDTLTAKAQQPTPPRLPALSWATPATNRTVAGVPGLGFPAARKQGLNPQTDLLPDVFDCYFVGEYSGSDVRAMTPTPDLRMQVSANGAYALNDGAAKSSGRWTVTKESGKTIGTSLNGPLVAGNIYLHGTDSGQEFSATYAASKRGVQCVQSGPSAELVRLELTKRRIGAEALICQDAGGGEPYKLTFGDGTYSTPKGSGRTLLGFSGNGSTWQGLADFKGGPFDLSSAVMKEDEQGNRELSVSDKTTTSGFLYSSSETTLLAVCRAKVTPKPTPIYGRTPAPKAELKGGPDGLFVSMQNHPRMVGNILMQWYELELGLFRPDGYVLNDIDPTDLGGLPDCAHTKPNGDPFCQRYELRGGKLRIQNEDDTWDEAEAYQGSAEGFKIGKITYSRVGPIKPADLIGVFSTDDFTGNGPAGGSAFGGAGFYNSLSNGYQFTPDGKFQWKFSSSSSTLISPNLVNGGGAVGGGGSTRTDGGQGSYTLKDNWLTLGFSDGRTQRLYVYAAPAADLKNDPTLGDKLNIGGTWLNRAPKN